jgi:hypothetical protein
LADAAHELAVRLVDEQDDVATAVRAGRIGREIWPILTIMALGALLLESLLAGWLMRRMTAATTETTPGRWFARPGAHQANAEPT